VFVLFLSELYSPQDSFLSSSPTRHPQGLPSLLRQVMSNGVLTSGRHSICQREFWCKRELRFVVSWLTSASCL
jgi:hypothetical protein